MPGTLQQGMANSSQLASRMEAAADAAATARDRANNPNEASAMQAEAPRNVAQGTTAPVAAPNKATDNPDAAKAPEKKYLLNSIPNPLEKYASVNYLFTMACLTIPQFNSPKTYRNLPNFPNVILSSAGRFDGERVDTAHGKPEYYIDNFKQHNIISPNPKIGNAYAAKYEFEVHEPYSMGVFLQTITMAANHAGYKNHLEAPFVIKLEFKGFDDDGTPLPSEIPDKFFVMKFTKLTFTADSTGSKYSAVAVPYNHVSYGNFTSVLKNDIVLLAPSGCTIEDVLSKGDESLVTALNKIEEEQVKSKRNSGKPMIVYEINFPELDAASGGGGGSGGGSATMSPGASSSQKTATGSGPALSPATGCNEIGKSKFPFDLQHGGNHPFKYTDVRIKDGIFQSEEITIDQKARKLTFAQNQNILSVITEVIKISEYVKKALKASESSGSVIYFKIDVQEKLEPADKITQALIKTVSYNVIPYTVNSSIFINATSNPAGYAAIEQKISKEYQYIYTGQNVDVMSFDININHMYLQGINPITENNHPDVQNRGAGGNAEEVDEVQYELQTGPHANAQKSTIGKAVTVANPEYSNVQSSGSGFETTETQVADNFHRAFIEGTSADMISLDLKILGDPYWLSDSGFANYTARVKPPESITGDGTMNYEVGDVFLYIVFRTPIDAMPDQGKYIFPEKNAYGGIYRVTQCENEFSGGMFTQRLTGIRMVGQSLDYDEGSATPGKTLLYKEAGVLESQNSHLKK